MADLGTIKLGEADIELAELHVPASGVWFADCTLVNAEAPTGRQTLVIGDQSFVGTVDDSHSGEFGAKTVVRLIGGANGWSQVLPGRDYPNDAGVKAKLVAADAARECGERLGDFAPAQERLGVHYVREEGPASRTIEDAARGAAWWVGFDGITRVGTRATSKAGKHTLLSWNPKTLFAELVCDSLSALPIGATIPASEVLPEPVTIQSLEIRVTAESVRVHAWCGEQPGTSLIETLKALIARVLDRKLLGTYHYRVIRMSGDRCDLQPVKASSGMPKLVTVSMWPGVSGIHCRLTRGTEVAVQFLDGDRTRPIVNAFVGRGGPGDVPEGIEIGGPNGALAARQGDVCEVLLPPCVLVGTIGPGAGTPFTAVATFPLAKTLGTITGGSAKEVRIK